jgi:CRP/FNR family transcriptional regulator
MKTITETDQDFLCDIQAPCFQYLSADEVELVRASKTQVLFRKGENLTKQGAFASYVLFVIKGMVRQYLEGEGNRNFNLRIISQGEFVGLSSVFGQNTFSYSSVALNDTHVYLVEKEAMGKVVADNNRFAFNVIKRYCEQSTTLFDSIQHLAFKQMNGRMADTLLYLQSQNRGEDDLFTLLTRKDIADFAGVSTESAVKLLKSFEKEGIIRLDEKRIELKDVKALQEISRHG